MFCVNKDVGVIADLRTTIEEQEKIIEKLRKVLQEKDNCIQKMQQILDQQSPMIDNVAVVDMSHEFGKVSPQVRSESLPIDFDMIFASSQQSQHVLKQLFAEVSTSEKFTALGLAHIQSEPLDKVDQLVCKSKTLVVLLSQSPLDACVVMALRSAVLNTKSIVLVQDMTHPFPSVSSQPEDLHHVFLIKALPFRLEYTAKTVDDLHERWMKGLVDLTEMLECAPPILQQAQLIFHVFWSHKRTTGQGIVGRLFPKFADYHCFLDSEAQFALHDLKGFVAHTGRLVFVLSNDVLQSPWCLAELEAAVSSFVPVIFVQDSYFEWPPMLPSNLSRSVRDLLESVRGGEVQVVIYQAEFVTQCSDRLKQLVGVSTLLLPKIQDWGLLLPRTINFNHTLVKLHLNGRNLDDESTELLCTYLSKSCVELLNVENNNIGPVGAKALAISLKKMLVPLKHLNLGFNAICDEGARAIAVSLEHSSLQYLSLECNRIGDDAAIAVGANLGNSTLQHLNLSKNSIGVEGVKILASGLKKNSTLQQLDLHGNALGDGGANELAASLANSSLQHLNLGGNNIGGIGFQAIADSLKVNPTLQTLNLVANDCTVEAFQALIPLANVPTLRLNLPSLFDMGILFPSTMQFNNSLSELNFDGSSFSLGTHGASILAIYISQNSSLRRLDLPRHGLGAGGAKALAASLEKNAHLYYLNLESNSLGDAGATSLAASLEMSSLQHLKLGSNSIGVSGTQALAVCLKKNRKLEHLCLNINRVGDDGAKALAECLQVNSSLQHLSLSFNSIGDVGTKALAYSIQKNSAPSLHHLILESNLIGAKGAKALAMCLEYNSSLCHLNLECNNIGDEGTRALGACLDKNSSLQLLNIGSNCVGDDGIEALSIGLNDNLVLQYLQINGNNVSAGGAQVLATSLAKNLNLSILDLGLGRNNIDDGVIAIVESLTGHSSLQHLDVSNNGVGDEGVQALAIMLKNSSVHRVGLAINRCGDRGATALGTSLATNMVLRHLNMDSNNVGVAGAKALAAGLVNNSTLQYLSLNNNRIQVEGAKSFGSALRTCSLVHLNLENNGVKDDGAIALAAGIETTSTLRIVSLGNNGIGDEGAKVLAVSLEKNSSLEQIMLSGNEIGDIGAKAIAVSLETNSSLQRLSLGNNRFGNAAAKAFVVGLKDNSSLLYLSLYSNRVNVEGIKVIAAMFEEKTSSLQQFILDFNMVEYDGAKALAIHLETNSSLKHLSLASTGIGDEGAKVFVTHLQQSWSLQHINLYGNRIGDEGARVFANLENLHHLNLENNLVGDIGAQALAIGLQKNTLQQLNLKSNHVGDGGAKCFAASLAKNSSLQHLNLEGNRIGNDGVNALTLSAEKNSLQLLNIDQQHLGVKMSEGIISSPGTIGVPTTLQEHVFETFSDIADKTAVVDLKRQSSFTYLQLNELSDRIACQVQKLGFKKGGIVCMLSPITTEAVLTFFGFLKAGGIVYVVDCSEQSQEQAKLLQQLATDASFFVTFARNPWVEDVSRHFKHVFVIFGDLWEGAQHLTELLAHDDNHYIKPDINPMKDGCFCFVSSSKIHSMLTHHNMVANIKQCDHSELFGITRDDSVVPLPFVTMSWFVVLLVSLRRTSTIYFIPRFDLFELLHCIQLKKVTTLFLVPPVLKLLAQHPVINKFDLNSLRQMFCYTDGTVFTEEGSHAQLSNRIPNVKFRQVYGPSHQLLSHLTHASYVLTLSKTVGIPVLGTECKIIDLQSGETMPFDTTGELVVRGPQFNEDLEVMDANEWQSTGNVGHYDKDGIFTIVGVVEDDQHFNHKGTQFNVGELEKILLTNKEIIDCAVIGVPDQVGGNLPFAFVVKAPGTNLTEEQVSMFVEQQSSDHIILEGRVEFLDKVPISVSGKTITRVLLDIWKQKHQH
eukprot:Lithocolla_globosa_v1_NODE_120_length_6112_cov_229.957240.p1 type:complete len:1897 gc:universal NODE_120_length_6112_cov_229.957240:270-5960(+)